MGARQLSAEKKKIQTHSQIMIFEEISLGNLLLMMSQARRCLYWVRPVSCMREVHCYIFLFVLHTSIIFFSFLRQSNEGLKLKSKALHCISLSLHGYPRERSILSIFNLIARLIQINSTSFLRKESFVNVTTGGTNAF